MDGSSKRVLILPDLHFPFEDRFACGAVLNYAASHKWDRVVQLGDLLDINSISDHNKDKPKLVEGERLAQDYAYVNKKLDEWQQATPGAKWTILKGNHEYRVDRYVEGHPALEGLIEPEKGLEFARRGIHYVRCYPNGEITSVGKAYFTHGVYASEHHAKRHVDAYGCNVIYGHTHQFQVFSKKQHGKNKTLMGVSLGCLCRYDMPYLQGRPTAWQHAFGVLEVLPSGFFNLFPALIFNGEFVGPDGKKYSYRDRISPVRAKKALLPNK